MLKTGTSTLLDSEEHGMCISMSALQSVVDCAVALRERGFGVVIVSSGAIGAVECSRGLGRTHHLSIPHFFRAAPA